MIDSITREIWNYSRIEIWSELKQNNYSEQLKYLTPQPSAKHIHDGKAYVFQPASDESRDEIFNWCENNLSEYLVSHDIDAINEFIVWIPNMKDALLFKMVHIKENPYSDFHQKLRELGLIE